MINGSMLGSHDAFSMGGRGQVLVMQLNPISIRRGSNGRPQLGIRPFNDPEVVSLVCALQMMFDVSMLV